ncbi:hypothetical protein [Gracilibacillus salinarum]|uniref:DUF4351 domain-containing protein n=1 Tax=Gracilibacillus salinarum TaxID=2932255 RepID=A0ABY4GG77_9BACI|nr:hypothetical protein [Gracilibacillus salinarum]UOQ83318.1 hypothetical protein MUN87_11100 [Gracilibacillus salinarum]
MSIADMLREEGKREGKKEGKKQTLAQVAIKLINKQIDTIPDDLEKKLYDQDEETLNQLIDQILELKTIDEIYTFVK